MGIRDLQSSYGSGILSSTDYLAEVVVRRRTGVADLQVRAVVRRQSPQFDQATGLRLSFRRATVTTSPGADVKLGDRLVFAIDDRNGTATENTVEALEQACAAGNRWEVIR